MIADLLRVTERVVRPRGRRAAALALALVTAGAALLTSCSSAGATAGTVSSLQGLGGWVVVKPADGPTRLSPTWSTTSPCPSGYQTSAILMAVTHGTAERFQIISAAVAPGPSAVAAGQPLLLGMSVAEVQSVTDTPNGATDEWELRCASGNSGLFGRTKLVQRIYVTYAKNGSRYSTSRTAPPGHSPAAG